jgi:hypothetical protein
MILTSAYNGLVWDTVSDWHQGNTFSSSAFNVFPLIYILKSGMCLMISFQSHKIYVVRLDTECPEYYITVLTWYTNATEISPQTEPPMSDQSWLKRSKRSPTDMWKNKTCTGNPVIWWTEVYCVDPIMWWNVATVYLNIIFSYRCHSNAEKLYVQLVSLKESKHIHSFSLVSFISVSNA